MNYDLVIIGTGPGGYVCAIRAAQLGLKVAVVEKRATHGGTCLNVGCIPSKALLHASEMYEETNTHFPHLGISAKASFDFAKMMQFKNDGVEGNVKGVEFLLKKNKIDSFTGVGSIKSATLVEVATAKNEIQTLNTKAIVIATGSDVAQLPGVEIDEKTILSSTGALELEKVPETMVVIGGGVIGLELGSVYRRLGAKVTVIEYLDRLLPGMDTEVAKQFQRILTKQGMEFKLGMKVTSATKKGKKVILNVEPSTGGESQTLESDAVLVAIGRIPFTQGLGLKNLGVERDNRGRIIVDHHFQTNVPGIYAIGDVITGPMLAHKAEDEGVAVAEILVGQAGHVNYDAIPSVVYTTPEVASVGKTEEELKAANIAYNVGKFPFTANGRAKVNMQTDGFVKILACSTTDRVLGVHILGPDAGNMIAQATLALEFGASSEDIARTCHAHPTLTEAVKEAALAVEKRAIHM